MSFFSKIKQAKKATGDQKKAVAPQTETRPQVVPYRHAPTHAAQHALIAPPGTLSLEEARARIAAERWQRSRRGSSSNSSPSSVYTHSGGFSEVGNTRRPIRRARSDISIDRVFREGKTARPPIRQPSLPIRRLQSTKNQVDCSFHPSKDHRAFSNPCEVYVAPSVKHRPSQTLSRRSTATKRKSPLSNVSTVDDLEDDYSRSSQDSSTSTSSSDTSCTSNDHTDDHIHHTSSRLPSSTVPKHSNEKHQPKIETSLPYKSNEQNKTAKSTIPTWRYEDYAKASKGPIIVQRLPEIQSRKRPLSSLLHRTTSSISVF